MPINNPLQSFTEMIDGVIQKGRNMIPGQEQQQIQEPKQASLQFVDDTWERVLNALERLEQVTEGYKNISASRLDRHHDKDQIREGELGVRYEVHLQIMCLKRVIYQVRKESQWLQTDFIHWFGGREGDQRPFGPTDEYAIPILKCIRGERYKLWKLPPAPPISEKDVLKTTETLGAGLHEGDKIVDEFRDNPNKKATRHKHARSQKAGDGLARLERLSAYLGRSEQKWVQKFVKQAREKGLPK